MADTLVNPIDDLMTDISFFGSWDPFQGTPFARSCRQKIDPSEIDINPNNDYLRAVGHTFRKAEDSMEGIDFSLEKQVTIELKGTPYQVQCRVEIYKLRVPFEADRKLLKTILFSHHGHRAFDKFPDVVFDRSAMHTNDKDENVLLRGPCSPPYADVDAGIWVYTEDGNIFGVDTSERLYPYDIILDMNHENWLCMKRHCLINVLFEVIPESVEANIDIILPPASEFGGEISATTEGHQLSKRILAISTKFDNPLHLARSVLAVRINEVLHLHFDLDVSGKKYKGEARIQVPQNASEISGDCNVVLESEWNLMKKRGLKRTIDDEIRKYRLGFSDCKIKIPLRIKVRFESAILKF